MLNRFWRKLFVISTQSFPEHANLKTKKDVKFYDIRDMILEPSRPLPIMVLGRTFLLVEMSCTVYREVSFLWLHVIIVNFVTIYLTSNRIYHLSCHWICSFPYSVLLRLPLFTYRNISIVMTQVNVAPNTLSKMCWEFLSLCVLFKLILSDIFVSG